MTLLFRLPWIRWCPFLFALATTLALAPSTGQPQPMEQPTSNAVQPTEQLTSNAVQPTEQPTSTAATGHETAQPPSSSSSSSSPSTRPFSDRPSNRTPRPQPLYFYPGLEGLVSQISHLSEVWSIARTLDRPVVAIPFRSTHYPGPVNMCNVFKLPPSITCDVSEPALLKLIPTCTRSCNFTAHVVPHGVLHTTMLNSLTCKRDFDWAKIKCYAGIGRGILGNMSTDGLHPPVLDYTPAVIPGVLNDAYNRVYALVVNRMRINVSELTVVHWRRGDQVDTRCIGRFHMRVDHSVNCVDVEGFYAAIIAPYSKSRRFYVATNEQSVASLKYLQARGVKTSLNFPAHEVFQFGTRNRVLSGLDKFVIELQLMCAAEAVWTFGISAIQDYIRGCRRSDATKWRNTLHDGHGMDVHVDAPPPTPLPTNTKSPSRSPTQHRPQPTVTQHHPVHKQPMRGAPTGGQPKAAPKPPVKPTAKFPVKAADTHSRPVVQQK